MRNKSGKSSLINIVTLGCSKNIVDSEFMMKQLADNNLKVVHNSDSYDAKTVIINTCGFIKDAKQESVDTILQFIKAKEKGFIDNVIVIGCLAERYKNELKKEIPEVDRYFGSNDLVGVIQYLGLNYNKNLPGERILTTPDHYAYLKISEGCNRNCAYCAIPLMRGRYVSKPMELLVDESRKLAEKGVKELIIIAQDLTYYGLDIYKKQALAELLGKISDVKGIEWIRLHYAYPANFPLNVIDVIRERDNICKYLDIPFQHASDKVLAKMNRGHDKSVNYKLIDTIRKEIPSITLRTTLMVGHPGEGEAEFVELKDFVEKIRFDRLGVFAYSEEEDTYSEKNYPDEVPEIVKTERATVLMEIQKNISNKLNKNKIDRLLKVLIDGREGENYFGRTEADSPEVDNEVIISNPEKELIIGDFYTIRITDSEEFDLFGRVENRS